MALAPEASSAVWSSELWHIWLLDVSRVCAGSILVVILLLIYDVSLAVLILMCVTGRLHLILLLPQLMLRVW